MKEEIMPKLQYVSTFDETLELMNHANKPLPVDTTPNSPDIASWTCLYNEGKRVFRPNFRVGGKLFCAEDESNYSVALVLPGLFNAVMRMMETEEGLLEDEYCSVHDCLEAHCRETIEEYYEGLE